MAADIELGDHPVNSRAIQLALRRLGEVQAITVQIDDEGQGPAIVDPGPLVSGALHLLLHLVHVLAIDYNADPEVVVGTLREHLETFDQ